MQEVNAGTGEARANLAMAAHAFGGKRGIVCGDQAGYGLDLLGRRSVVLIVAGERDADAACVDPPVARVPADGAVLQQPLAGAVQAYQPVIGEEDHASLAKVARPDGLAPDCAAHNVILQIVESILAQQADGVELRQGYVRLLFGVVQHDRIERPALGVQIGTTLRQGNLPALKHLARQAVDLVSPDLERRIVVNHREYICSQLPLKPAVPVGLAKLALPMGALKYRQHRLSHPFLSFSL